MISFDDSHLLFFQAPKREGLQIGEDEIEQGSDRQDDKWDEEEDRQEEEQEDQQEDQQVQYRDTTARSNLYLFPPLCRSAGLAMRGKC